MIRNSFKLLRYSDNFWVTILCSLLSLALGVSLLFAGNSAMYGCLFIALSPMLIAYAAASMTMTESIAASPIRRTLVSDIPDILMLISIASAYICLYICFDSKLEDNVVYGGDYIEIFGRFYFEGVYAIFFTTICLAIANKYTSVLFIYIALMLASDWIFDWFSFSMLDSSSGSGLHTFFMHVIGIVVLVAGYVIARVLRERFDESPFSSIFAKANDKKTLIKLRIPLIIAMITVAIGIGIGWYIHLYSKQPDGWYDKASIKEQYEKLMEECDEELQFENFTVNLQKKYYNATTGDGCFLLTIIHDENLGGLSLTANSSDGNFSLNASNDISLDMIVDGNGVISIEDVFPSFTAIGVWGTSLYVYVNLMPDTEHSELPIYFIENSPSETGGSNTLRKEFIINDNSECVEMDVGKVSMFISPAGLLTYEHLDVSKLRIVMKDEETLDIVDNSKLNPGFEKYENKTATKYCFNELIDISNIKEIEYEGSRSGKEYYSYDLYSSSETYNMKQTLYASPVEGEENLLSCTMDIQWKQMPTYRETDFIHININGATLYSPDDIKVTQKFYETIKDKDVSGNWSQSQYLIGEPAYFWYYKYTDVYYLYSSNITPNTYAADESITACLALHEDTLSREYTDESITFEMLLKVDEDATTVPTINCSYLHQKLELYGEMSGALELTKENAGIVGCIFNQKLCFE